MKKPDFDLDVASSNLFSYHDNVFATELSTLEANGVRKIDRRVYNDACDVGFMLRSARTGKTELFVLASEDRDDENELQALNFVPANLNLLDQGVRLVVFND